MKYSPKYRDRIKGNCGIYMIRNTVNGKVYVGQSQNIYWRWSAHKSSLRHGNGANPHIQSAWNKYGEDAFEFCVIELCDEDRLDEREEYWIDALDSVSSGYNIQFGGGRFSGWHMTDEQRKRISMALTGRPRSEEHCRNISKARKEYYKTHEPSTMIPVVCLNTGEYFKSATEAHRHYPCAAVGPLLKCCNGGLKSCGKDANGNGLVWALKDNYESMSKDEIAHRLRFYGSAATAIAQSKPVRCLTTGLVFDSCADAAKHYHMSVSNLNGCLKGRQPTAGKDPATKESLHWAYVTKAQN